MPSGDPLFINALTKRHSWGIPLIFNTLSARWKIHNQIVQQNLKEILAFFNRGLNAI